MSSLGLGYSFLSQEEQHAYSIMKEALDRRKTSCDVSKISRGVNLSKILGTVLGDNPEIIYFNKTMIRTMCGIFAREMSFVGCMNPREASYKESQLKEALEDAVWEIDKLSRSDYEILQGISEYLQRNVRYDFDELKSIKNRSKRPLSHTAYGALVNKLAVCDGYSSAYALIAQYFGFKCMIVEGHSSYSTWSRMDHAWNIVEYEGAFYHIDATWDSNTYESMKSYSYDYFGLNDDEILRDHGWEYRYTPKCNQNKLSYFHSKGLVASSESQIVDLLIRELKHNKSEIRLKLADGIVIAGDEKSNIANKVLEACKITSTYQPFTYVWNEKSRGLLVKFS